MNSFSKIDVHAHILPQFMPNLKDKYAGWLKNAIGSNVGSTTRVELAVASKVAQILSKKNPKITK